MPNIYFHGSTVHYEFRGTPEGSRGALVLLHGFLEDSRMWHSILPQFQSKGPVLLIDLPGHGKTPSFGYEHTMEFMADAVHAVIESLKMQEIVLLGHSMGGYVGLAFTELYPELLGGLGLFFSSPHADSLARQEMRDRAAALVKQNKNAFIRAAIPQLFDEESRALYKAEIRQQIQYSLEMETQGVLAAIMGMKVREDRSKLLHVVPEELAPNKIAVFAGEQDTVIDYALVKEWRDAPGVGFTHTSTHGHMGHISDAEGCAKAILDWWNSLY
jgi:pimeloyl-ACP methyl ester carboxylesterase